MPVIGSGHPMADIFMLKYQARPSELHEGVAFFGRAGTALMKSCQRLKIDPLQLYGTNVVKCGDVRGGKPEAKCLEHLRRELAIVSPKLIVAMGEETVRRSTAPGSLWPASSSTSPARSSSSHRAPRCS